MAGLLGKWEQGPQWHASGLSHVRPGTESGLLWACVSSSVSSQWVSVRITRVIPCKRDSDGHMELSKWKVVAHRVGLDSVRCLWGVQKTSRKYIWETHHCSERKSILAFRVLILLLTNLESSYVFSWDVFSFSNGDGHIYDHKMACAEGPCGRV